MGTVAKALSLLQQFDGSTPQIGLSELARRAGLDKATTRRLLVQMLAAGLVEQDSTTREYRIGSAVLRLARVREASVPIESVVRPVLVSLTAETGETSHFSLLTGGSIATIAFQESSRANRVTLEVGQLLPAHATASGLAIMAAQVELPDMLLARPLKAYTRRTETNAACLLRSLARVVPGDCAVARDSFEEGVTGVATAVTGVDGKVVGAVAVAAPSSRVDPRTEVLIRAAVRGAGLRIATGLGAAPGAAGVRKRLLSRVGPR